MPTAGPLSRMPALSRLVAGFALLLLAVTWIAAGTALQAGRSTALESERRQNRNLASALSEQALRVIAPIDQATQRVAETVVAAPDALPDLVRLARETGLTPGILVQLSLVGPDGRFVASNLDPTGEKGQRVDLSEREHVRAHLAPERLPADVERPARNGLFIGKPVLGKVSGRWTIQLSRRIAGPGDRTLGVVVASLDPSYFEEVFRGVSLGRTGGVTLVGSDLAVRARVIGGQTTGLGGMLSRSSGIGLQMDRAEGDYIGRSALDGVERLVVFRRVSGYPLTLLVSSGLDEALDGWRSARNLVLALAAALSVVTVGAAGVVIAGLRRMEHTNEALRASEAAANAASQAKSEFLAAISHDLRTPLTSIRGFAELLEHRQPEPKFREMAGLIRKGAEHLNTLVTEILDLTKVEAGAMELSVEPVELRPLVHSTADLFALAATQKGLQLEAEIAPDVPEAIQGDSLRLKQVLHNLLSNAVKFTGSGTVRLRVEAARGELLFHVDDTGPGVPPEMQEAIFERFRQGSARVSYEHGGSGLGLALSRALAGLMHGRLTMCNRAEGGARFTLAIPQTA